MASFCIQGYTHEQRIRLCWYSSVDKPHRHCPFCTFICKNNPATWRTYIIKEHATTAPPTASPDTDILAHTTLVLNTPTSLWAVRSSNHELDYSCMPDWYCHSMWQPSLQSKRRWRTVDMLRTLILKHHPTLTWMKLSICSECSEIYHSLSTRAIASRWYRLVALFHSGGEGPHPFSQRCSVKGLYSSKWIELPPQPQSIILSLHWV